MSNKIVFDRDTGKGWSPEELVAEANRLIGGAARVHDETERPTTREGVVNQILNCLPQSTRSSLRRSNNRLAQLDATTLAMVLRGGNGSSAAVGMAGALPPNAQRAARAAFVRIGSKVPRWCAPEK